MQILPKSKPRDYLLAILSLFIWLSLQLLPWSTWLDRTPILAVLLAFSIFIVPGICLAQILGQRESVINSVTTGFAYSITLFGSIFTLGRILHWSFNTVSLIYTIVGAIFILWAWLIPSEPRDKPNMTVNWRRMWVFIPLILSAVMAFRTLEKPAFNEDDYEFAGYTTRMAESDHLDFKELFFDTGTTDHPRWWLSAFQGVTAFLAKESGTPSLLLLTLYFPPILLILALLALWGLSRELGFNSAQSALVISIQLVCAFLLTHGDREVGSLLFGRTSQDKVVAAFVLAPLLIRTVTTYMMERNYSSHISLFLFALSLIYTHNTVTAIAFMIALGYGLGLALLLKTKWQRFARSLLVLLIITSPMIVVRMTSNIEYTLEGTGQEAEEKINTRLFVLKQNDLFYGYRPDITVFKAHPITIDILDNLTPFSLGSRLRTVYAPLGWLVLAAGTLTSIVNILKGSRDPTSVLILASVGLCIMGVIPYTGWLLGLAISPLHLWRVTLFAPYGLAGTYATYTLMTVIGEKWSIRTKKITLTILSTGLLGVSYFVGFTGPRADIINGNVDRAQRELFMSLIQLGRQIDRLPDPDPVIVGTIDTNDFLLGISSKTRVVGFRHEGGLAGHGIPWDLAQERQHDWVEMIGTQTSDRERLDLLSKWGVEYLLFQNSDSALVALVNDYPDIFSLAAQSNGLRLYAVQLP